MGARGFVQRLNRLVSRSERAGGAAFLQILRSFSNGGFDSFVDERFGREHDLASFKFDLEVVARRQSELVVELSWDDDLSARPDFNGGC